MLRLEGKVAVITGGASGMGAATARIFVREGGRVVLGDMNAGAGAALVEELGKDCSVFMPCDVSDQMQMNALVDAAPAHFGKLDFMFNNAGIGGMGSTTDTTAELWRKVMEVDLFSVFYGCQAAIPHLRRNGGGAIVNNASVSGMFGEYGMVSYAAAKGGVINYTRSLALDLATEGIRVNAVCPGPIDTPLFSGVKQAPGLCEAFISAVPMRRLGTPEEVGEVVAFLASDAASYMTGAIIPVDGGVTSKTGQPNMNEFMSALKGVFG